MSEPTRDGTGRPDPSSEERTNGDGEYIYREREILPSRSADDGQDLTNHIRLMPYTLYTSIKL